VEFTTYFAYGSNLNHDYLWHYLEGRGVSPEGVRNEQRATLHGWRLRTNCATATGGMANIERRRGSHVEGWAMEIAAPVHKMIREKERWPDDYRELAVTVELAGPPKTRRRAVTYVARDKYVLPFDVPVTAEYRRTILTGARRLNFSTGYQKHLRELLVAFPKHKKIQLMKD
jgi:hypothetical protein